MFWMCMDGDLRVDANNKLLKAKQDPHVTLPFNNIICGLVICSIYTFCFFLFFYSFVHLINTQFLNLQMKSFNKFKR
jgi:hypothetical protein